MNAARTLTTAVAVALLSNCAVLTPPTATNLRRSPYPERDLTTPWAVRTYWSHPDGVLLSQATAPRKTVLEDAASPPPPPTAPTVQPRFWPRDAQVSASTSHLKRNGRLAKRAKAPPRLPEPPVAPPAPLTPPVNDALTRVTPPEPTVCFGDRC
jgi:hypothetical protein